MDYDNTRWVQSTLYGEPKGNLTLEEAKLQIQRSMQTVIDSMIASYGAAIEFIAALPLWGFMIVRSRASAELESWGIPEPWADWLAWNMPRRYCVGFVKMIRRWNPTSIFLTISAFLSQRSDC